jgi:hypothetical protein
VKSKKAGGRLGMRAEIKNLINTALDKLYSKDKYLIEHEPFNVTHNDKQGNGTCPDLIIHKHGNNDFNLLVVGFKAWWSKKLPTDIDRKKLGVFTQPPFNYQHALLIILNADKPNMKPIK